MKKRNWVLILGVIILSGCLTSTQLAKLPLHSITGKITDHNDKPIEGAIVTTTPPSSSVATDAQGNYIVRKLPIGEYAVNVYKHGFAEETVTVVVGGYDYPTQADVHLLLESMVIEESPIYVNEVSAEKYSEDAKEEASSSDTDKKKKKKKNWWEK